MVERHLATVVEPHDITLHQYTVLRILREAGEALPTMAIAERMIEQTPGITRMLDRLERKGLVRRDRDGNDRRQVLCNITDAGRALVDHLHEPMSTADEAVLSTLTEDQLTSLLHMLDSIRGNCG